MEELRATSIDKIRSKGGDSVKTVCYNAFEDDGSQSRSCAMSANPPQSCHVQTLKLSTLPHQYVGKLWFVPTLSVQRTRETIRNIAPSRNTSHRAREELKATNETASLSETCRPHGLHRSGRNSEGLHRRRTGQQSTGQYAEAHARTAGHRSGCFWERVCREAESFVCSNS